MSKDDIPCGIYRTTRAIEPSIPAGALVFYHNHGDPGPGVYMPKSWTNNRARFHEQGTTVPDEAYAQTLQALPKEGYYRVKEPFYCCENHCRLFEENLLVQLGYNGQAQAIVFTPELVEGALAVPSEGQLVDDDQLSKLAPLKVAASTNAPVPSETMSSRLH
jgi:hypothetical protein